MRFIYTTGWTRKDIQTSDRYQEWLKTVKRGDLVVVQSFHPASDSILDYPFERWRFELHYVGFNDRLQPYEGSNDKPFNPETGMLTYWNSDMPHGEVFPSRIVPVTADLEVRESRSERVSVGHMPVYEPLFLDATRCVFLVPHNPTISQQFHTLTKRFPYSYKQDVDGGWLVTAFTKEYVNDFDWGELLASIGCDRGLFLYSKYIAS